MMAEGPLNGDSTRSSRTPGTMKESSKGGEPVVIVQHKTTCGECKKKLKNPHLLCCLHSVCAECLPNMAMEGDHVKCGQCGDTSTHCSSSKVFDSECRADIVRCVPVLNGPLSHYMEGMKIVEEVAKNALIPCGNKRCRSADSASTVYCVDCSTFMCERCNIGHEVSAPFEDHTVKTLEEISSLSPEDCQEMFSKNAPPNTCPQHRGKALEYICEQCDLLMCQVCAVDHKTLHTPVFLSSKMADHHTQSIKMAHQAAVCFGKKCKKIEKTFQSQIRTVDEMKEAALVDIDAAFQTIHEAVEKRKEELRKQVVTTAEEKKHTIRAKLIAAEREKEASANAESSLEFLVSCGSSHDMLACKDLVQTHQSVVTSKWCQEELESTVSCMLTFDQSNHAAVLKALEIFGDVVDGACPVKCTVEPKPEYLQSNGSDPVTLKLTTFDSKGIACKRGGDKIEGFIVSKSPIPGPAIKARVVDDNNGRYTLSFPSTYCGECELSIQVNGSEIRGSPFAVTLYRPPVWPKLSRNVRDIKVPKERLQFPYQPGGVYGVAVSQNGTIFVSDCDNHKIHVFSKERNHMRVFGQHGSEEGQLYYPRGLALDSGGIVYVANSFNHRVEVLGADGAFVRQIGAGQLKTPYNITIHNQLVYVADSGNSRISIYTMQGQLVHHIGEHGKGSGQFKSPVAVAFSPDGDMYVSDNNNYRIQVLDANGQFKRQFGTRQFGIGKLNHPHDLVITADGDVLVADIGKSRVAVFDCCGTNNNIVHIFHVDNPCCLAIDSDGDILVTCGINGPVAIF